jgi:hypothetical protein
MNILKIESLFAPSIPVCDRRPEAEASRLRLLSCVSLASLLLIGLGGALPISEARADNCGSGTDSGLSSVACGTGSVASGDFSTAIGNGSQATGYTSTATGSASEATGDNSTATGESSQATGVNSTATGDPSSGGGGKRGA